MAERSRSDCYVLDASAVLALLNAEPGGERVAMVLDRCVVGAVNYAEVVAKLVERGLPAKVVGEVLDPLHLRVVDFDKAQAVRTGELRAATRQKGLSAGDRAYLALAAKLDAPALTTDTKWSEVDLGVRVEQLRP